MVNLLIGKLAEIVSEGHIVASGTMYYIVDTCHFSLISYFDKNNKCKCLCVFILQYNITWKSLNGLTDSDVNLD